MKLLLDTCSFLWIVADDARLSPEVRELFVDERNEVLLSTASAWEIAVKYRLGKLKLQEPPTTFVPKMREAHGIETLPVDESSALLGATLPQHHRDPFDRMLICQAITNGAHIATPDPAIAKYPVLTVW